MRIYLLIIFTALSFAGFSQSGKKKATAPDNTQQNAPSSVNPYAQQDQFSTGNKSAKKGSSKSTKVTYNAERTYYERVETVAKTRRKNEKLAQKPQYSDPLYFGHKKIPKKNPPNKMKFCKECGIRH